MTRREALQALCKYAFVALTLGKVSLGNEEKSPEPRLDLNALPTHEDMEEARQMSGEEQKREFEKTRELLSSDVLIPKIQDYVSESLFFNDNPNYFEDIVEKGEYSDIAILARMMMSEDDIAPISISPFMGHVALNRVKQSRVNKMPWTLRQVILGYDNDGAFGEQKSGVPFSTARGVLEDVKELIAPLSGINDIGHKINALQIELAKSRPLQTLIIADMLIRGRLDEYNFGQNLFMHPQAQEYLNSDGSKWHKHPHEQEKKWVESLEAIRLKLPLPDEIPEDHIWFYAIMNPRDPFAYKIDDLRAIHDPA